jgi:hypothetical protein
MRGFYRGILKVSYKRVVLVKNVNEMFMAGTHSTPNLRSYFTKYIYILGIF